METEEMFKIRSYGWTELALCYNPCLQPGSAARLLRRWVRNNKELDEELKENGFRDNQRKLTPFQVGLLVRYLGEP